MTLVIFIIFALETTYKVEKGIQISVQAAGNYTVNYIVQFLSKTHTKLQHLKVKKRHQKQNSSILIPIPSKQKEIKHWKQDTLKTTI